LPSQARPTRPARSLRARLLRAGIVTTALTAGFLLIFSTFFFKNNFDIVDPGLVYRSAQPKGELRRLVAEYHLATIVNLRGGSEADPWYHDEVRATSDLDVAFYDLPMLATRRPGRCDLLRLLDLLGHCRYPILIHCKSGSDRTGLASGLYLLARRGLPPTEALRTFSIYRGHVPLGGPERLQEPFQEYDAWLKVNALVHTPARFRDWVERLYRDDGPVADCPPLRAGPRPRVATGEAQARIERR
jgi:protein tyrosine phosphatase (PTP) superfamily phosphohydrolase (DUF442 family)